MFVHCCLVFILSLPLLLSGMAINDGDSAFDLSTDPSSSKNESQHHSQSEEFCASSDGASFSEGIRTNTSFHLHDHSQSSVDEDVDIPLCEIFTREQWVGLDVVLLNHNKV